MIENGEDRAQSIDMAIDDLETRTLSALPGSMTRLVYLASTRDYNSGRYWHEGLARGFSASLAEAAIRTCHESTFAKLTLMPLKDLVGDMRSYLDAIRGRPEELLKTWKRLQPFRVLMPLDSDPLEAELLCSNIRIALEVLAATGRRNGVQASA